MVKHCCLTLNSQRRLSHSSTHWKKKSIIEHLKQAREHYKNGEINSSNTLPYLSHLPTATHTHRIQI